jgi:hypothetical protein
LSHTFSVKTMKPNSSASGVVNGAVPFFTFSNVNAVGAGLKRKLMRAF